MNLRTSVSDRAFANKRQPAGGARVRCNIGVHATQRASSSRAPSAVARTERADAVRAYAHGVEKIERERDRLQLLNARRVGLLRLDDRALAQYFEQMYEQVAVAQVLFEVRDGQKALRQQHVRPAGENLSVAKLSGVAADGGGGGGRRREAAATAAGNASNASAQQ